MARRPDAGAPGRVSRRESRSSRPHSKHSLGPSRCSGSSLGMIVLVGTLFAWHRTEEFLIRDRSFRLAEPHDFAGQSPSLIVEGIHYASPSQIRHVFAPDFGRSLYLVPIAEAPARASGDRLGGGRDGIEDLAGHGEGAHSRAAARCVCASARRPAETACRSLR